MLWKGLWSWKNISSPHKDTTFFQKKYNKLATIWNLVMAASLETRLYTYMANIPAMV